MKFELSHTGALEPLQMIDPAKQYAYRYMLYWAMLDIRQLSNLLYRPVELLNPLKWRSSIRQAHRVVAVADWLQNLAFFSAHEFRDFEEDWFWRHYQRAVKGYPELNVYEQKFNDALVEYSKRDPVT